MQWIVIWVGVVMEALTAASFLFTRNPRAAVVMSDFLTKYAKYCVDESVYLWRWAQLRIGDAELVVVAKDQFVKRVMDLANIDLYELLRLQNIPHSAAQSYLRELETRVYMEFIRQLESGVMPTLTTNRPPAMPWLPLSSFLPVQ